MFFICINELSPEFQQNERTHFSVAKSNTLRPSEHAVSVKCFSATFIYVYDYMFVHDNLRENPGLLFIMHVTFRSAWEINKRVAYVWWLKSCASWQTISPSNDEINCYNILAIKSIIGVKFTTGRSRFTEWYSRFHIPFGKSLFHGISTSRWHFESAIKDRHSNSNCSVTFIVCFGRQLKLSSSVQIQYDARKLRLPPLLQHPWRARYIRPVELSLFPTCTCTHRDGY